MATQLCGGGVPVSMTVAGCRAAHLAGSDDEEHFQNKDRARLARDKLRLNPVILGLLPGPSHPCKMFEHKL